MNRVCDLGRDESGQAMAEYAILLAGMFALLLVLTVPNANEGRGAGFTFLPDFIRALQRYYDSFYIMLNLPIP